jgi:hypothetical protein
MDRRSGVRTADVDRAHDAVVSWNPRAGVRMLATAVCLGVTTSGCLALGEPSATPGVGATSGTVAAASLEPTADPSADAFAAPPTTEPSLPLGVPGGGPGIGPVAATPATRCPGTDLTPNAGRGREVAGTSLNWSGYVAVVRRTAVTCVEGTWIQPAVKCPRTGSQAVAIWIGIDGFSSRALGVPATSSLVQIGTQVDCRRGIALDSAWHEVLPAEQHEVRAPGPIRAGDHIAARILYLGRGRFLMTLVDRESGLAVSRSVTASAAPRRTAEWIVEAPATGCPKSCRIVLLPHFAPITLSTAHATIGGQRAAIDDDRWAHVRLQLSRGGILRITASRLSTGGTQFRVTWVHT